MGITDSGKKGMVVAKKHKLTWQAGADGRGGRWRKKYKGKVYYFPGGRKTDRNAYDEALKAWERKKVEIDDATPKPHEAEYEKAMAEWETVLQWCRKNGDQDNIGEVAVEKLKRLRKNLDAPKPEPVSRQDTLDGWIRADDAIEAQQREAHRRVYQTLLDAVGWDEMKREPGAKIIDTGPHRFDPPDPRELEAAVWKDRLNVMERTPAETDLSLGRQIERFLSAKAADVSAGKLSKGRLYEVGLYVGNFADWAGRSTDVTEINGTVLVDYKSELMKKVDTKQWSKTAARHRMIVATQFLRWLATTEVIESLPKVLTTEHGKRELKIAEDDPEIVVFTKEEIHTLIREASRRTKLYILLALNCAFVQKDCGDLRHSEVHWNESRIIRKRSKTKRHARVPIVSYKLWDETRQLLDQERSEGGELVLLNEQAQALWRDEISDGKYQKCDAVASAYSRLAKKCGLPERKPFKSLKKTSATLIRENPNFSSLEHLFLGHASGAIAHRHYTVAPQTLLDEAISWLREKLQIEQAMKLKPPPKQKKQDRTR